MCKDMLRRVYEDTLHNAAENGKSDFRCGILTCRKCPFVNIGGDPTVKCGAGEEHSVNWWQNWWYEQTGERDIRTVSEILSPVDSTESAEDSVDTDTRGEDTLQPVQPTLDITWTTATGKIERHAGPMSLLSGEMDRFRKELSVWMERISRPVEQIGNSVADSISFTATDSTGAVIAKCELFAELFGKCKCWRLLEK